jgi:regulatory protein
MNIKQAMIRAEALCSRQEKCRYDIREKLVKWDVSEGEIEKILAKLEAEKFIDESRYAEFFVRDKFRFNKWGKIKISFALKQKKIPEHIIQQALESIPEEEYLETLTEELQKKRKSVRGKNAWDIRNKLTRFAQQRGFEFDLIQTAIDSII